MLKRNYFYIISFVVVMSLVFGASEGVDAKGWPNCPSEGIHNQGPGIRAHFEFLEFVVTPGDPPIIREDLEISGNCKNITLESPILLYGVKWGELDIVGDGLDKADLKGNVFQIKNTDDATLWGLILACFGLDAQTVCLKIVSVSNFTDHGNGEYSADVILLRVVTD